MNLKTLYAFIGGAVMAGTLAFLISTRQPDVNQTPVTKVEALPPVPSETEAPPSQVTEPESQTIPDPVKAEARSRKTPVKAPGPSVIAKAPVRPRTEAPPPVRTEPAPPVAAERIPHPPPEPEVAQAPPAPADPPARTQILRPDPAEIRRAQEARKAETVTIPAGTVLHVRLNQSLSSKENEDGDTFSATLDEPLVANGFVIAEKGSRVDGRVISVDQSGRVKGLAQLSIALYQLHTSDHQKISISTDDFSRVAESSKKSDAAKVGIATGVGAALGAIFGGGKGAAIGAASGGAAGTGTVLMTRGKPAEIGVETRIPFRLRQDVTITENLD